MVYDSKDVLLLYHFLYDGASIFLKRKQSKILTDLTNIDWQRAFRKKYSKYVGVTFDKRRSLWMSTLKRGGHSKFLGYFDTEDEAFAVREKILKNQESSLLIS